MKDFITSTTPDKNPDAAALLAALFVESHDVVEENPSQCISPSGLECQCANAWKLRGAPVTPHKESFQSASFADAGTDRHARIQAFLSKTPYWVDIEQYIKEKNLPLVVLEKQGYEVLLYSEEYQCRFRLDGMLLIGGSHHVLEIKTERQNANSFRKGPDSKHIKQGLTYSLLLDTNSILWVYEGRDFLDQLVFLQPVNGDDKKYISNYLKDIIKNKDTPEKLERNTKLCTYCAYKNYCKMYFKELERKMFEEAHK